MHVLETVQRRQMRQAAGPTGTTATAIAARGALPRGLAPGAIHGLQRGVGNAAVSRVIQRSLWDDFTDTVGGAVDTVSDAASDAADWVGETAEDAADWVGETAEDAADWVGETAEDAGDWISDTASDAWDAVTGGVSDLIEGARALGQDVVDWIEGAAADVRDAVTHWGARAWAFIAACGTAAFEQLVRGSQLFMNWVMNLPERLWRVAVHAWDGIQGAWAWLSRAGGPLLDAIRGVWSWVGGGIDGLLSWLADSVRSGAAWVEDFLAAPSFEKLVGGMLAMFSNLGAGLLGLARWGLDGLAAAAQWIVGGLPALGRWLKDGLMGGLAWAGEMLILLLELFGVGEALQLLWGLLFDLRPLDGSEQAASEVVHPAGLIPYGLVRVDEEGLIIRIAQHFQPSTLAVTTLHIISANRGTMPGDLAAHELTHVGQYEAVGAMYMPEAIHAQHGAGYDYGDLTQARAEGKHFSDFNREQQASLCEAYYVVKSGGSPHYPATEAELDPFIAEMRAGGW